MAKRPTLNETFYGPPPGADAIISIWNASLIERLFNAIWQAYDVCHTTFWSTISWDDDYANVERAITEKFERVLSRQINSLAAIDVQHGPYEEETRDPVKQNAQPPQYDIAFVWNADERIKWPLEAKVLQSDKNTNTNLKNYVETINDKFLTCTYAPFSNGAAMLGYLKLGDAEVIAHHIGTRLGVTISSYSASSPRCHKVSDHLRIIPAGKDYPANFRLHHLIFPLPANNP